LGRRRLNRLLIARLLRRQGCRLVDLVLNASDATLELHDAPAQISHHLGQTAPEKEQRDDADDHELEGAQVRYEG